MSVPSNRVVFAVCAGSLVALVTLTSCQPVPTASSGIDEAATIAFTRDHYCPTERVTSTIANTAPRPPATLTDPERAQLWSRAHPLQDHPIPIGGDGTLSEVTTAGCGERARYACWTEGVPASARREGHPADTMVVCLEHKS